MNEPYRIEVASPRGWSLPPAVGLGVSIVAGGLFTYFVSDLTAPHYLLELMSLLFVEAPFIALFALLARKFDVRWFAIMAAASLIIGAALFEPHLSLTSLIYAKIIAMGYVAGRFEWYGRTFFRRMSALAAPGFLIAALLGGPMLYTEIDSGTVADIRAETLDVYRAFMTEDEAQNAVTNAMQFFGSIFTVAVAFFMVFTLAEAWLSLQLGGWLLVRFGERPFRLPPFHTFKLPFHAVWFFLAGGLVMAADVTVLYPVAVNVFAVMSCLYGIQGLAVVVSHARTVALGRLPKILFWVIFFLTIGFTGVLLVVAGVLDNWFNLRSFPATPGGEREGNTDESHFT